MTAVRSAIETHELTKRYRAARGIEDLTMSVPRGEVFGFLGPNGAGKTTTIGTSLRDRGAPRGPRSPPAR